MKVYVEPRKIQISTGNISVIHFFVDSKNAQKSLNGSKLNHMICPWFILTLALAVQLGAKTA